MTTILKDELVTKENYQMALHSIDELISKAFIDYSLSKKQIRKCMAEYVRLFIRNDLKSKDSQHAYIIANKPSYEILFECYDENLETYQRLLRLREDTHKLMSMSQSEMRFTNPGG